MLLRQKPIDLVLLDYDLGKERGFEFISQAREWGYQGRFLMVTAGMSDAESVRGARSGGRRHLSQTQFATVLIQAIRKVMAGETWLDENAIQALVRASKHPQRANQAKPFTERETQVLQGVFEGLSNKEIGARLNISESSVKAASSTTFPENRGKNPQPARPDCAGRTRRPLEVEPHLHVAPWLSFAVKPTAL